MENEEERRCSFVDQWFSRANTISSDLADAYPNGELVDAFRQDWMTVMIKETKTNREFSPRTIETARWAREQVKRQLGGSQNIMAQS
jgi:importin subunit beta-1